jgi:DNA-binding XRE family transcriptional regulator
MNRLINEKAGAWLLEQGHTRETLAEKIGITRPTLNSRLDGRTKWNWEEVVRLSKLLGCTLDELAGFVPAA